MASFSVTLPSGEIWTPRFVTDLNQEKCIGCARCVRVCARDVLALVVAGLRGGGWQGSAADLLRVEIGGGPVEAARAAAELLARAFALPGEA